MTYILVIFTIVSAQVNGSSNWAKLHYDWRTIGEFKSDAACVNAAHQLGMHGGERFRCLPTDASPAPKGGT